MNVKKINKQVFCKSAPGWSKFYERSDKIMTESGFIFDQVQDRLDEPGSHDIF